MNVEETMRRLLEDQLTFWKQRLDRKPLLLKGVRQCGKTHYEDVAYFNFEVDASLRARFAVDLDVRRIVDELGILLP
jgi:predicted AAA+ superfamily ATPase